MTTTDNEVCYNPGLFVDDIELPFTVGGGNATHTVSLNSAALGWLGSEITLGEVTGLPSGSTVCSVSEGVLTCTFTDPGGSDPGGEEGSGFSGGQCDLDYNVTGQAFEDGVPVGGILSGTGTGPLCYEQIDPAPGAPGGANVVDVDGFAVIGYSPVDSSNDAVIELRNITVTRVDGFDRSCEDRFTGGQCPVEYIIEGQPYRDGAPSGGRTFGTRFGPLRFSERINVSSGDREVGVAAFTEFGTPSFFTGIDGFASDDIDFRDITVSRLDGLPDDCGDQEYCNGSGGPPTPSQGVVEVTYTGCFPRPEPDPDPPTEPPAPANEPDSNVVSSRSAGPGPGVGEGGPSGPTEFPRNAVTFTTASWWPRTPAAPAAPVNVGEPWYPIYGTEAISDPSFRFYLPPLFTVRDGTRPTLSPWNGVAVLGNAPGDTETGVVYRAVYATPPMSFGELRTNKRVGKLSTVFDNRTTNDVLWTPLNSSDEFQWGSQQHFMSVNLAYITEDVEGEVSYQAFSFDDTLNGGLNHYDLTDSITLRETFKGVSNRFQGAVWSSDEGTWNLEGFQLAAETKGTRTKRSTRR